MEEYKTTPESISKHATSELRESIRDNARRQLEANLRRGGAVPALLERFFGGRAQVIGAGGKKDVPVEDFYARIAMVRQQLTNLRIAIHGAEVDDATREKLHNDLGGIGGALTTFNVLFKDKGASFKGAGK